MIRHAVLALLTAGCALCQVRFKTEATRIDVEVNGQPFTSFFFSGDAPKPYLHPLRTANGKVITRNFPMENVAGETRDHPHHRGLWFTHGDINGFDFWMNEKGHSSAKSGVIVTKEPPRISKNTIHAVFEWRSPDGKPLLTEDRTMIFVPHDKLRITDFDVTFAALDTVKFGDTKEGFFAIRLRDELTETKGTGKLVNAEGAAGMKSVWGKASPWVDYSGELEGEKLGVAIFDHPGNPKHPTYWHARDYGLFAANALGEHDFFRDKARDGSITLKPGDKLRFRYRVVIHPGDTASAGLGDMFKAYAASK